MKPLHTSKNTSMGYSAAYPTGAERCLKVEDSHQHHFSETPVFAGCGVMAVGTNESNTYRRTERKNTVLRSANQYSRTQPITCRKWRF